MELFNKTALVKVIEPIVEKVFLKYYNDKLFAMTGLTKRERAKIYKEAIQQRAFRISETANYIGTSTATVYRLEKNGKLKLHAQGGTRYTLREDLDNYLEKER